MHPPIDWLLAGEAFVRYRTRLDLLGESPLGAAVRRDRQEMLAGPHLQALLAGLADWPGQVIASHKSAGQPFHRLTFLADLGLTKDDPGMAVIIARILARRAPEGPFQLPANIPTHYGGSGREVWGWALCDAPLILYALACFGLDEAPTVRSALEFLVGLASPTGWPCAVAPVLNFRGPGRKEDPCPFATLAMLKALAVFEDIPNAQPVARQGAGCLLSLWEHSRDQHPYIFHMGTDFRKIKAPFIWYDLLHVLEVLSRYPWLGGDARLEDMLSVLKAAAGPDGRFTPASVWTAWKDWEFGQKKEPSRWLTLLAWRIILRLEGLPAALGGA